MLAEQDAGTATDIDVPEGWLAIDAAYGGYVVTLAAHAAAATAPAHTAWAIDVQFTGVIRPGPARVLTRTLHAGRATSTIQVRIEQDGGQRVIAVAKLAAGASPPLWRQRFDPSELPPPEASGWRPTPYGRLAWEDRVEVRRIDARLHPDAPTRAWVRLVAGTGASALPAFEAAPLLLDPLPSGLFGLPTPPVNVPTIEFALHVLPVEVETGAWHLVSQRLIGGTADTLIEESALWDRSGEMVAVARQVRRVMHG